MTDDCVEDFYKDYMHQKREKVKARRKEESLKLVDLTLKQDKELFANTLKLKSSLYVWIIFLMGRCISTPW